MSKQVKTDLIVQSKPILSAIDAILSSGGESVAKSYRDRLFKLFASHPVDVVAVALDTKAQGIAKAADRSRYQRMVEARALFRAWRNPRARAEVEAYNGGWHKLVSFAVDVAKACGEDDAAAKAERNALATVLAASGKTLEDLLKASEEERAKVAATVAATVEAERVAKVDKVDAAKAARQQPAKVAAAWIKAHQDGGFAWMFAVAAEIAKQVKLAKAEAERQANAAKQAGDDAAAAAIKDEYTMARAIKAAA